MKISITKTHFITFLILGMTTTIGCKKSQLIDSPVVDPIELEPGGGGGGNPIFDNNRPELYEFSIDYTYLSPVTNELKMLDNPQNFLTRFSVRSISGTLFSCWATVVLYNNDGTISKELSERYKFFTDALLPNYQAKSLSAKLSQGVAKSGDQVALRFEYFDSNNKLVTVISPWRYMIANIPKTPDPIKPNPNPDPITNPNPGVISYPMADIPENAKYVRPGTHSVNTVLARNGNFHLDFQSDGNLVLYNTNYDPLWHSKTMNMGGNSRLTVYQTGSMEIRNGSGNAWNGKVYAGNNKTGIWVLQDDGNLVCYNGSVDQNGHVNIIWGDSYGATMTQGGRGSRHQGRFVD